MGYMPWMPISAVTMRSAGLVPAAVPIARASVSGSGTGWLAIFWPVCSVRAGSAKISRRAARVLNRLRIAPAS